MWSKWPFLLLLLSLLQRMFVEASAVIEEREISRSSRSISSENENDIDKDHLALEGDRDSWYEGGDSPSFGSFRDSWTSDASWAAYQRFKEETCRTDEGSEIFVNGYILNNTGNEGYFLWESIQFHRELRKILFPATRDGSLTSLVGSSELETLDSRLFASMPVSLCKGTRKDVEKELMDKDEKDRFEDFLINKIITRPPDESSPRKTLNSPSDNAEVPPIIHVVAKKVPQIPTDGAEMMNSPFHPDFR